MLKRVQQFAALSWRQKRFFIEAWFWLGFARISLRSRRFKQQLADLEVLKGEVNSPEPTGDHLAQAHDIGESVRRVARFTLWESACLVQALTAQRMLARRGIGGSLVLAASLQGDSENKSMSAHAWVKCGSHFITGRAGHKRFTPVSTFSWQ